MWTLAFRGVDGWVETWSGSASSRYGVLQIDNPFVVNPLFGRCLSESEASIQPPRFIPVATVDCKHGPQVVLRR